MPAYTFDSSTLIRLQQQYPRDIFLGAWEALEALIDEERGCICSEVLEELARGGDDLHGWAKGYDGFACPLTQQEADLAADISGRYPEWVRETKNAGDPFLIAHGSAHSRVIVTEERAAGANVTNRNQKIPNVAATMRLTTMNFFDVARAEGWQFR